MAIHFFTEDVSFKLNKKKLLKSWLTTVISNEGKNSGEINFIFTSDNNILQINKQYLAHDYFTDIITFNYNQENLLNGDIFISIDTVGANAYSYSVSFEEELNRVMVHGVLHLIGYDDINEELKAEMRAKEDFFLHLLQSNFSIK